MRLPADRVVPVEVKSGMITLMAPMPVMSLSQLMPSPTIGSYAINVEKVPARVVTNDMPVRSTRGADDTSTGCTVDSA